MQDSAYAELFSHRATYSGTAPVGEWPALPFADVLQAVGNSHCHVVVTTSDGLWGSAGLHDWARLETLAAGTVLLEGLASVSPDGRVSALDCAGNATLIATLDTACARSVTKRPVRRRHRCGRRRLRLRRLPRHRVGGEAAAARASRAWPAASSPRRRGQATWRRRRRSGCTGVGRRASGGGSGSHSRTATCRRATATTTAAPSRARPSRSPSTPATAPTAGCGSATPLASRCSISRTERCSVSECTTGLPGCPSPTSRPSPSAPPSSGSARRAASRAARRRMASGGTSPGGDGCPARR